MKSVTFKFISKEISQAEHEYMNIHPPPPPLPINERSSFAPGCNGACPRRGFLIPLGYFHPGKCEHGRVQNPLPLWNGWSTLDSFRRYAHARVQAASELVSIKLVIWLKKFCIANITPETLSF